jgi:hypothetical protein
MKRLPDDVVGNDMQYVAKFESGTGTLGPRDDWNAAVRAVLGRDLR